MKNLRLLVYLLVCTIAFSGVQSCSKDGSPGEDGIDGTDGIDGADGTKIYSGSADPTNAVGAIGDFYININSGVLFGPKAESGWGTGFPIRGTNGQDGTDGTNGKDGATVLNGRGVPSDSLGKLGDFYINTETLVMFGPKTSTGWGDGISLRNDEYYGVKSYKIRAKFNRYTDDGTYEVTFPNLKLLSQQYTVPFLNSSTILGIYVSYGGVFGLQDVLPWKIYNPHKIGTQGCNDCWVELSEYDKMEGGKFVNLTTRTGIGNVKLYYGAADGMGGTTGPEYNSIYFMLEGYTYRPIFSDGTGETSGPIEREFDFLSRDITVGMMVKYIPEKEYQILAKQHRDVERFLRIQPSEKALIISK